MNEYIDRKPYLVNVNVLVNASMRDNIQRKKEVEVLFLTCGGGVCLLILGWS